MKRKVIYYCDELNDEFAGITKNTIDIPDDFPYIRKNPLWNALAFVVYNIIMRPFAYIYCKVKFSLKIVNRDELKNYKDGCFLYCNHTLLAGDAFIPNAAAFPKKVYMIVGPDNISTPGTKNFVLMCGAIPIPSRRKGYRGFLEVVRKRQADGCCVVIYPEAHIWPYYTGIRKFSSTSFGYPIKLNCAVFSQTVTYQKRKFFKTPKITAYIDGPFFPDDSLPKQNAQQQLYKTVYDVMCQRAEKSTYSAIQYVKSDKEAQVCSL